MRITSRFCMKAITLQIDNFLLRTVWCYSKCELVLCIQVCFLGRYRISGTVRHLNICGLTKCRLFTKARRMCTFHSCLTMRNPSYSIDSLCATKSENKNLLWAFQHPQRQQPHIECCQNSFDQSLFNAKNSWSYFWRICSDISLRFISGLMTWSRHRPETEDKTSERHSFQHFNPDEQTNRITLWISGFGYLWQWPEPKRYSTRTPSTRFFPSCFVDSTSFSSSSITII